MKTRVLLFKVIALIWILAAVIVPGAPGYIIMAILPAIVALYLGVEVACLVAGGLRRRPRNGAGKDFTLKLLALLMVIFFLTGTELYIYVFHSVASDSAEFSGQGAAVPYFNGPIRFYNVEYLLRSMFCSLNMFMFDVDSGILDRLDVRPMLRSALYVQAVLSSSCTFALLFSLVFSRARAYYRLRCHTAVSGERNNLYLFFGVNEPSKLLARSVVQSDSKAVVIFVDKANINDDDNDGWNGIVGWITHRRQTFELADSVDAGVSVSKCMPGEIEAVSGDDVFGRIGLDRVRTLIENLGALPGGGCLNIFFLSENEEENIDNVLGLAKDGLLLALAGGTGADDRTPEAADKVKTRIFCHARHNGPNRVIEDLAIKRRLEIRVVDSSHIAVEILKSDVRYHPVNVVELSESNPGTVSSKFDSLIVGFGEVGRDSFRFLYEFGAFVDSTSPDDCARRSPFRCTAVDRHMDKICGSIQGHMPAINFDGLSDDGTVEVELLKMDCRGGAFYSEVMTPERARSLNYVVIALDDDENSMSLAVNVFTYIRRYRDSMDRLRIMVRCVSEEKRELMQKIADHYNKGCTEREDAAPVINLFGGLADIYSYRMLVSDHLTECAKVFNMNYSKLNGGKSWTQRRRQLTATGPGGGGKPYLDRLSELRRKEGQDKANAFHMSTKLFILRAVIVSDSDWQVFADAYFDSDKKVVCEGKGSSIRYSNLTDAQNRLILNLAKLEHIRWNASHEILGYVRTDDITECCERTRSHNCLKAWEELDDESKKTGYDYKKYDFGVVDTSIAVEIQLRQ